MPREGAIIFADLIDRLDVLRTECAKCGRRGRYRVDRLVEQYGPEAKLFDWSDGLTADCPRKLARNASDPCGALSRFAESALMVAKAGAPLIASRLTAEERVLLFCIASGTDWTRVGISSTPTRGLVVKDLVEHDPKTMRLVPTKTGRAVLQFLLGNSGIKFGGAD